MATSNSNETNNSNNNNKKNSPELNSRVKLRILNSSTLQISDSEASLETNSLSADSGTEQNLQNKQQSRKKRTRKDSEWEIMEGLKDGQRHENKPDLYTGYLHKKRKWPLKGWHKRYFILEKGILVYGKNPVDIKKGKIHGTLDIGLSVITTKSARRRIDIDAEEFIYHLKAKTDEIYTEWVRQLTDHRLYRQHVITYGTNLGSLFNTARITTQTATTTTTTLKKSKTTNGNSDKSNNNMGVLVHESAESLNQYKGTSFDVAKNLEKMTGILQQLENSSFTIPTLETGIEAAPTKKDRRKFGLRKKKTKTNSVDLSQMQFCSKTAGGQETENISPLSATSMHVLSASQQQINTFSSSSPLPPQNLQLSSDVAAAAAVDSLNNFDTVSLSAPPDAQLREDFLCLSKNVLGDLKKMYEVLNGELERIKNALDEGAAHAAASSTSNNDSSSNKDLEEILKQNLELKNRLSKIHKTSNLHHGVDEMFKEKHHHHHEYHNNSSLSYSSSCVSATEFYDAEAELPLKNDDERDEESEIRTRSETSSEADSFSSGEGSILSSESDLGTSVLVNPEPADRSLTGRRTSLPAARPQTGGLSLWNLLSKNIGKDLSQISMPVALNEPLNALQRLCEELEYSELLDRAANLDDPYERMVYVAAFAVSAYASTLSRAGNKPFNPLLGETYECIREDKGFKFIAEQVSHHPPISACYAESPNWTFWQDARIKTKFWGKSMEFQPQGNVHVLLPKTGDFYSWNKVTTCVHNLFSQQRWVDQYGELRIDGGGGVKITCKLTFSKASYWSSKRHEVVGAVYDEANKPVRNLFGKWSESLYCGVNAPSARCIWRAGTLPENQERFYGFTRFALELNELFNEDSVKLPPTDTRFRPDQRALEKGDLNGAESLKLQLENAQRERRKRREDLNLTHEPRWFSNPKQDIWEFNGKYWDVREKNMGFNNLEFDALW